MGYPTDDDRPYFSEASVTPVRSEALAKARERAQAEQQRLSPATQPRSDAPYTSDGTQQVGSVAPGSVHTGVSTEVIEPSQVRRHSWAAFRESGMLWLINTTLHVFGWSIVVCLDESTGEVTDAYPARVSWRGFSVEANERGHARVARYLADTGDALVKETGA